MITGRFRIGEREAWGILEGSEIREIEPDPFQAPRSTGRTFALDSVRWLAPGHPSKVIAIGLNYKDHIREFGGAEVPEEPVLFLKAPTAVIGPEEPIVIPRGVGPVDYEGELGVVIGRAGRRIPETQAMDFVAGLTCFNDVTARAVQRRDGQWARAKSYDTFAPVGPWIVSGLRPDRLGLSTRLNGRTVQSSDTSQMLFPVARLVAFVSGVMTLAPGDVLATGTPVGVGPLRAGDVVEIVIEGVGTLRNPVIEEP